MTSSTIVTTAGALVDVTGAVEPLLGRVLVDEETDSAVSGASVVAAPGTDVEVDGEVDVTMVVPAGTLPGTVVLGTEVSGTVVAGGGVESSPGAGSLVGGASVDAGLSSSTTVVVVVAGSVGTGAPVSSGAVLGAGGTDDAGGDVESTTDVDVELGSGSGTCPATATVGPISTKALTAIAIAVARPRRPVVLGAPRAPISVCPTGPPVT